MKKKYIPTAKVLTVNFLENTPISLFEKIILQFKESDFYSLYKNDCLTLLRTYSNKHRDIIDKCILDKLLDNFHIKLVYDFAVKYFDYEFDFAYFLNKKYVNIDIIKDIIITINKTSRHNIPIDEENVIANIIENNFKNSFSNSIHTLTKFLILFKNYANNNTDKYKNILIDLILQATLQMDSEKIIDIIDSVQNTLNYAEININISEVKTICKLA